MKKTLLASAITLSVFGLTTNLSYAEENQAQSTPVETTHSETATDKVEKHSLPAKETEASTEANANQTTNPTKKEEDKTPEVQKEGWVLEENHWHFYENNAHVLNWKKIHGKWYYFNKDGIMLSDTIFDGYILTSSGAMVDSGWSKLQDKWYYANAYGKISQQKWEKIGGVWYYFDQDGVMLSNTIFDDYLFTNSGAMAESSWVKQDGQWYYALASGKLIKNKWDKISGTWYYFNKDATMASNQWQGSYYLKASGAMAEKEWIFDKNYDSWFYLKSGGAYAEREWIGSYYLKAGGYMAKSEWIDDSFYKARYYVDDNGVYVTGTHKIDGQTHQFQSNGKWIGETSVSRGFEKGKYNNIIFLDPGHGGKDPGASYYNITEKELNMQVYQKLRKELEGLGYTVLSSRDSDVFVDFVTERSRMVNKTDSDIFISIHFNASGNPASNRAGIQTYSYEEAAGYPSKINPYWHNHPDRISESNRLAADIHSSLLAETGAKDAGLLQSSFAVLRETDKPAVLLELGYIDNFNENQQVRSDAYQNRLVAGIVKGIQKYYAGQ
ncbi:MULTISPECIES: N-acetylmuramoyl-L-alanine amidase [unclassified Streptococcus]|uniref:N-acetylmuramoyl-L-alanine amidase n=1 Tax=unclassified Streptococcus TaxID=2608887 RepID=UPI00025B346F|nr:MULTISPECIES: N-acetylmuramoyl-L-alanine amidase [unclassified Streptococcus]EIF40617.1 N-acetylmuramoyl-L-alanine amidase [Streptococcus sp. SK140]OFK89050.1 N-acetylmuramoyl-L-alanine amidase [Streptococcus sp. HMSC056C01]